MNFINLNLIILVFEKKIITIDDEDEDVMECKPEDFIKNVGKIQKPISKIKTNLNSLLNQKPFHHSTIKNQNIPQSLHRKYEKKSTNILPTPIKSKQKKKDEDTESKSETIDRYKEMMFSNTNRILLGENYQAEMPEFFLNNSKSNLLFFL